MLEKTGSICLALSLTALGAACGSTDNGNDSNSANMAGMAGATAAAGTTSGGASSAGTGTGGATANGGNAASTAGTGAGGQDAAAGHGGSGGSSTLGGQGGTGGGSQAAGGTGGGSQAAGGSANGGGPASTAGLAFTGSCLYADHCTDEWDTTFGAAALEQICTGQQGTWSTGHCATAAWKKKKCTQSVLGGVYVQFLPADGICAAGFEEQL